MWAGVHVGYEKMWVGVDVAACRCGWVSVWPRVSVGGCRCGRVSCGRVSCGWVSCGWVSENRLTPSSSNNVAVSSAPQN